MDKLQLDAMGISIDLSNVSVPLILAGAVLYMAARWVMEYAMMSRHVRRWPLAQMDFRFVLMMVRIALLSIVSASLERSLKVVLEVIGLLALLVILSVVLGVLFSAITIPFRTWVRVRAKRRAYAAISEGLAWAFFFSVAFIFVSVIGLGVATYYYEPFQTKLWGEAPDAVTFTIFLVTLLLVFISFWFLSPVINRLFAEQPSYYTERTPDGKLRYCYLPKNKEPLL